ncbi:transposase [Tardiphaga sp.]|uniref:transposase n=1 Tax=Tardiphaga sp. TaxID=1926292 RepID=UPI0037DA508E
MQAPSSRDVNSRPGLVPRQNESGGKMAMGEFSKRGESYLRRSLVLSATTVMRHVRNKPVLAGWVNALLFRRRGS